MTCPNCGAILDDRSQYCNQCGQAQRQAQTPPPPPDYEYQRPTGDTEPRPAFSSTGQGGSVLSGAKTHLILSICCFGWAGLVGLPKAISFLATLPRWNWGVLLWPPLSGIFGVAIHFVLPLVGAFVLLGMYRRNNS